MSQPNKIFPIFLHTVQIKFELLSKTSKPETKTFGVEVYLDFHPTFLLLLFFKFYEKPFSFCVSSSSYS